MQTEIQSLQNSANSIGLVIHEKFTEDKRKTVKKHFATKNGSLVSPNLDYLNMNHFLLGWHHCLKSAINDASKTVN